MHSIGTALAAALLLVPAAQAAQPAPEKYPTKPIRLIVPFPPGGGSDAIARAISTRLTEAFGHQVVVDNRAGANGIVAAEIAATSLPDGYTLFIANVGSHAINPAMYKQLPYDPIRDFTPVGSLGQTPNVLAAHPSTPANSVSELIALAKSRPGKLNYGSTGVGSSQHLSGVMFGTAFGLDWIHVPYKGIGPAVVDLLSGQIPLAFATTPAVVQHVRNGKLKALAVTSLKRSSSLPNVPTVAETLPGFSATSWWGIAGPAKMPANVVNILNAEMVKALNTASMKEQMDRQGVETFPGTPAEFAALIQTERTKWAKVVKDSGATAE
jgi:tripartite-type tricarboxylate transporter receptor subunit TctC